MTYFPQEKTVAKSKPAPKKAPPAGKVNAGKGGGKPKSPGGKKPAPKSKPGGC